MVEEFSRVGKPAVPSQPQHQQQQRGAVYAALQQQLVQQQQAGNRQALQGILQNYDQPAPAGGSALAQAGSNYWGTLLSQTQQIPSCVLQQSVMLVGRSIKCQFCIPDSGLSSCVCRLRSTPPSVECATRQILVDGRPVSRGQVIPLKNGTEIKFQSATKVYAFTFQGRLEREMSSGQIAASTAAAPAVAKSLSFLVGDPDAPPPASSSSGRQTESPRDKRPTDLLFALASPPHPPPSTPAVPSAAGAAAAGPAVEASVPQPTSSPAVVPPPLTLSLKSTQDAQPMELTAEAPAPCTTPSEKPVSPTEVSSSSAAATATAAPPSAPTAAPAQVDGTQVSASKLLEELSAAKERFRQVFRAKLLRPEDTAVSFENFVYYLSEDVRRMLVSSAFVFLQRPEFAKFASDLSSLSRKILLSGPSGTELYQEALAKALAKHFNARALVIDSSDLEPRPYSAAAAAAAAAASAEQPVPAEHQRRLSAMRGLSAVIGTLAGEPPGSSSGEDDDDLSDPRTLLLDARLGRESRLGLGPAGRVVLRKGERVRFVGGASAALMLHPDRSRQDRGPALGARGTVVVTIDESPRKVGVQFDKAFPGGVDLGGMSKEGHGMFVDAGALVLEDDAMEDESAALEAAVEVLDEAAPAILVVKSADKTILATPERYANFKRLLGELTRSSRPTIVLGTTTVPIDAINRDKAKHGAGLGGSGLSFITKNPHHTGLVDFSFLDHLSRGAEERGGGSGGGGSGSGAGLSREVLKAGRVLGKLFPTRIPISLPKDGEKLSEWREQIDRDVECVKSASNRQSITRALQRSNVTLTVPELTLPALRKQVFSADAVDKIVGWAISDHLQRNPEAAVSPAGQLAISPDNIERAIVMLVSSEPDARKRSLLEVETENEFEKRLLAEVIPPEEVSLSFDDIGALEEVKETLRELVMLPLQRPELFRKGNLTRPCKGILLFGPPGTGKVGVSFPGFAIISHAQNNNNRQCWPRPLRQSPGPISST